MFFFMTADKKRHCYPVCFLITADKTTVLPFKLFIHDDQKKTTVLPLMFFSWRPIKKRQCYPLCFFSWRPIKNDSVTPYVFFMTTYKKSTVLPLTNCLLLKYVMFVCAWPQMKFSYGKNNLYLNYDLFSWRPIKNGSVTPYTFFHDDQWKTTVLPLTLFSMTTY